ncbi:MAG: hypothetical protein AAF718_13775 [Pseudomonadota bacterium]
MKDIEPNPKLNKVLAGLISTLSIFPLYMGLHSLTFLRADDRLWALPPIGLGVIILMFARRIWRRPSRNQARILFRDGGFRLETRQVFRPDKDFDFAWTDIREITGHDVGLYGGRLFRIWYGNGKENAYFAPAWTNAESTEIVSRLSASADAAGFLLEKTGGFWSNLVRERWIVKPKQPLDQAQ